MSFGSDPESAGSRRVVSCLAVMLAGMVVAGCFSRRIAFSPEICEIAVRDVRRSVELKRIKDRARIDEVLTVLRAERQRRSQYGNTLPAGRFNFLFFACNGPVHQLAMGVNFLVDYHAREVYTLAPHERKKLKELLKLRF